MVIVVALNFLAPILGGIAVGQHLGLFDGCTAALVIWALIPWAKLNN
jgi:hypothetical protein